MNYITVQMHHWTLELHPGISSRRRSYNFDFHRQSFFIAYDITFYIIDFYVNRFYVCNIGAYILTRFHFTTIPYRSFDKNKQTTDRTLSLSSYQILILDGATLVHPYWYATLIGYEDTQQMDTGIILTQSWFYGILSGSKCVHTPKVRDETHTQCCL